MTLSRLNTRLDGPRSPLAVAAVTFVLAAAAFLVRTGLQVGFDSVPGPGDEADYDLLAMELAAGRGFRFDDDDTAWREPYERANVDGSYDVILKRHGSAPTTYRPPLFPTVVAGLYAAFGRNFAVVRIFNCLAMAAAGGVAAWLVARRMGPLPGLLCGLLFAVVEHRARYHSGLLLTESLASLLAVLLAASLIRFSERGLRRSVVAAGLWTGLAILNRPLVALWLPVLIPLVAWLSDGTRLRYRGAEGAATSQAWRRRFACAATFTVASLAVVAPWAIRNSLLLGRFAPLGTHGQQNLAAAYSDEAVKQRGIWFNLDDAHFFPPAIDDSRPGLDRELARAKYSRDAAVAWMKSNPHKLPALAALRTWQLWRPRMHWDALVLGLAAFGLVSWPVRDDRRVFVALLIANTLAVAATWSVGGRFLVPLLPILHAAAACGAWVLLLATTERRMTVRRWITGDDRGCDAGSSESPSPH